MPCCHADVPTLKSHGNVGGIHFFSNESVLKHTSPCYHAEDFLCATIAIAYRATAFLCRWMSRRESRDIGTRERSLAEIAGGPKELGMMHFPYISIRVAENKSCRFKNILVSDDAPLLHRSFCLKMYGHNKISMLLCNIMFMFLHMFPVCQRFCFLLKWLELRSMYDYIYIARSTQ